MPKISISREPLDPRAPTLSWPGKQTSELVVEAGRPPILESWGGEEKAGSLILGDNLEALAGLEPGSVRLAYLDPPFFSEKRYSYTVKGGGEWFRIPSFEDRWGGDLGAYLSFLEVRLRLLARALSEDGSLYVHLDASAGHYVKVLLDEILGAARFSRQIVWRIGWVSGFKSRAKNWIRNHDVILYYSRPNAPFTRKLLPHPEGYARRAGQKGEGRPIDDVWLDIPSIQLMSFSLEKTGWATQKNESLLARIIEASSEPGDLVVDPFSGAGTTAVAAATLGRRFITIDRSQLAIHLARRRLLSASVGFVVRGEAPPASGPVLAELVDSQLGPKVRLEDVPSAEGPPGVGWRGRVDGWWVARASEPTRPIWQAHRTLGREPQPVQVESPPLAGLLPDEVLKITVIDLAGSMHEVELASSSAFVAPGASMY